mmetsp:Transcript_7261/g.9540  ORF Transcript_7261/g.9540 Transcript_7261/m.9540 type:complete len:226 (-) Transcript_7261:140-817(-)
MQCFRLCSAFRYDFNSIGFAAAEHHARHQRGRHDGQVRTFILDRSQIGEGRAPPFSFMDRTLIGAEAFLLSAIEVFGFRVPRLNTGTHKHIVKAVLEGTFADMQRAATTVEVIRPAFIGLRLTEIRQHIRIPPAGQPRLAPLVVISRMAANIDHAIDRGRTTPAASARPVQLSVIHVLLRRRPEAPVLRVLFLDEAAHARRHANQERLILLSRFNQTNRNVRVFT